jgi:hypothetical protein
MTDHQPDPRDLWRDQQTEGDLMSIEQVRAMARDFNSRGKLKRVAAILATLLSASMAWRIWSESSNDIVTTGAILLPLAMIPVTIHTFFRTRSAPAEQTAEECLTYVKARARRELAIMRGDWMLIGAPVFMAIGVMFTGLMIEAHGDWAKMLPVGAAFAAWLVIMLVMLRRKSQSLSRELADLEKLSR